MSTSHGGPTFHHGVHPPENKHWTSGLSIERMPFVDELTLPLSQHIGAPAKAIVTVGQDVKRGEQIAAPGGFVSTSHHAPVTGRVVAIEPRLHPNGKMMQSIVIRTDPYSSQRQPEDPNANGDLTDAVKRVQQAGLVGLGGAAFPSHVKLSVPDGKHVDTIVINGCECEPFLTCDHRIMVERPEAVVRGTEILVELAGASRGVIGVELNKPDAIAALKSVSSTVVEIKGVQVKYPQGAEKMLIQSIFGKQVPAGGLPLDLHMVVNNVGTAASLADFFDRGLPLVERVVTVTGAGIARPRNLMVPLGTPVSAVLEYCGGLTDGARQVILGGPMMGMSQKSLEIPTLKGTSGILCLDQPAIADHQEYPCIRCGRCLEACPMFLNPARLARMARNDRAELLEENNLMHCFECASCSFVCPSRIPLVQWMRMGKAMVRAAKAAK